MVQKYFEKKYLEKKYFQNSILFYIFKILFEVVLCFKILFEHYFILYFENTLKKYFAHHCLYVEHRSRLTSLSFIGLVEARVDVLVMSAFNRNEHGRIGLQRMFGVMDGLVTR